MARKASDSGSGQPGNSLFESEARHHSTYVQLAGHFSAENEIRARLDELASAEAAIIAEGDPLPRMHS